VLVGRSTSPVATDCYPGYGFNPLKPELNPFCHLLTLLWAHHIFHISRIRFKVQISRTKLFQIKPTWCTLLLYYIYFNFSTCFGQLCAHHQEDLLYGWCVWSAGWDETSLIPTSTQDSHQKQSEKYQYCIDTVSSPDDGHIVARNM